MGWFSWLGSAKKAEPTLNADGLPVTGAPADWDSKQRFIPTDMRPSAIVVGAGIAGLHSAQELAQLGFKVTVVDERSDVALGATRYDHGVFGAGRAFAPTLWQMNCKAELFGSMFPMACRGLLGYETPPTMLANFGAVRWAYCRRRVETSGEHIQKAAAFLAKETESMMHKHMTDFPELQEAVIATTQVKPDAAAATAGGVMTTIDTVKWCTTLAGILTQRYNVDFLFKHEAVKLNFAMSSLSEYGHYLTLLPPAEYPGAEREASAINYDLMVLATGAGSNKLSWMSYPLPILAIGGYGIDVPHVAKGFEQVVDKFRRDGGFSTLCKGAIRVSAARPDEISGAPRIRVSGLASLYAADFFPVAGVAQSALAARANFVDKIDMPKVADDARDVEEFRFVRGVTPDGLPIVSRLGNVSNVFVVSGFGDDATLFAAGSAKIMSRLVTGRAVDGEDNPFALSRFKTFRPIFAESQMKGQNYIHGRERALMGWADTTLDPMWYKFRKTPQVKAFVDYFMSGEDMFDDNV
jgi:glycine/D-amino acid oxidase-like deaminating enzyme